MKNQLFRILVAATLSTLSARGADAYWDINGATAGSGNAGGTWSTSTASWTSDSTGSSATANWNNGDNAIFSAGSDQTSQINVTESGLTVGNITQKNGRVRIQNSGTFTLSGTSVTISNNANSSGDYDLRIDPALVDSGSGTTVTKTGNGVLLFESPSTFTGGFVLNGGSAGIENGGWVSSPFGYGTVTVNAGNIEKSWGDGTAANITNAVNVAGWLNLAVVQGQQGDIYLSGTITGNGSLSVSNVNLGGALSIVSGSIKVPGDLSGFFGTILQTPGGNRLRFGPLSGSGLTTINGQNASFITFGSTSSGNPIDLPDNWGGTFRMGALSGTGGILRGGWPNPSAPLVTIFEIGALNSSSTYSGSIQDNNNGANGQSAVTKVGTGALTLSFANTYSGGTIVSNGTLLVANISGSGTGSGTVTVTNGAAFGGSGSVSGAVSMAAGTILTPGTNSLVGNTLTVNSNLTLSGVTNIFDLTSSASGVNDQVAVTGTLTIGSADTIKINPITASTLDISADYTLFTAATVTGSGTPAVVFGSSTPSNPGTWSILVSGTAVKLHYTAPAGLPPVVGNTSFMPISPVIKGTAVTASASVTESPGATGLAYRWQSSANNSTWANASGAFTSATYSPSTSTAGTTYYRLIATDSFGSGTNAGMALVVNNPSLPVVGAATYSPSGTVAAGTQVIFSAPVTTNDLTISFQWQSSLDNSTWNNIYAATNATYTNADVLASAYYRLTAVNTVGSAAGGSVQLLVAAGPSLFDYGSTAPGTNPDDVAQFDTTGSTGNPDGMNYYVDNGNGQGKPGQTFTTGSFTNGYDLSEVYVSVGGGNGGGTPSSYTLHLFEITNGSAVLVGSASGYQNANTTPAATPGHWLRFCGFTPVVLSPNTTYAWTFERNGSGWWYINNSSINPYAGGELTEATDDGTTLTYDPSGNYDATFLVRLAQNVNPLTITTNPVSVLVGPGGSGSFGVSATSDAAITGYQWYRGVSGDASHPVSNGADVAGTVFSGATTATLAFSSAATGDNGNSYWCQVTSSYGGGTTANSSAATLGVYAPKSLSWMASPADANWNMTSLDWSNMVSLVSGIAFSSYDNVTFDDTGSGGTITIAGTVQPGSVTVHNSAKAYTLAGGGKITGSAGLTKTGNGTLTITTTGNDFTGGTIINGGVLSISSIANAGVASPIGAGSLTLNGGTLQFTGSGSTTLGVTLGSGGGTFDVTSGNSLVLTSAMIGGSGGLTKIDNGTLALGPANSYNGNTLLAGGILSLGNNCTNSFGNGTLTLSNATLLVQPNSGGPFGNNADYIGSPVSVPAGTTSIIDNSANSFGNLWLGGDSGQWTGSGTVEVVNNSLTVANTSILWNGNPLANFQGTINCGSFTNTAANVYNGLAYSSTAGGGVGTAPTTFDSHGTAWVFGDVGSSLTQVIDPGCTNVLMGSISATNASTVLRGNNSASQTTFVIGYLNTSTLYGGQLNNWGAGGTALTKIGTGTLTFSGANNYSGPTIVSNGTLIVPAQQTGAGTFAVSDGATLGVAINNGTLTVSELTLGDNGNHCTNTFIGVSSTTQAAISDNDVLTLNSTVAINVVASVLNVGQYPLISAANGITGPGGFVIGSLPFGTVANIVTNGNTVTLNVTAVPNAEVWKGNVDTNWNFTTANWSVNASPGAYVDSLKAQFDDTANSSRTTVNLVTNVSPIVVLMTNNSLNYTFSSTSGAKITGAVGITLNGTGELTLLGLNNDFTGPININNGTLAADGIGDLGHGHIYLAGTLAAVQGFTIPNTVPISVGPSTGGNGTISVGSTITLADNTAMGDNGTGPGTLVKTGSGTLQLGASSTFTGGTVVSNGVLTLATGGGVGAIRGSLTIEPGATVKCTATDALGYNGGQCTTPVNVNGGTIDDAASGNEAYITTFNLSGGTMSSSGGGAFNFNGGSSGLNSVAASVISTVSAPITLRANGLSINTDLGTVPSGIDLIISGAIGGGGNGFSKDGAGLLELTGANTYTGTTTVNNGTLLVNSTVGGAVNVQGGTLGGTGTIGGAVTVNAGTLAPGTSAIGTLTINNNLTLTDATLVKIKKGITQSNDVVNVSGTLAYGGTLIVTNIGSALIVGDNFRIFPSGGAGSLAVSGSPGNGLMYSFNDGLLSVVPLTGQITNNISGNTLNLTWPSGQGWRLVSQTNGLSIGLSPTGWTTVSGASDGGYSITIDPTQPTVFYELVNP